MPQSLLTGQLLKKPTYRVRCLYSSFVHAWKSQRPKPPSLPTMYWIVLTVYYSVMFFFLFFFLRGGGGGGGGGGDIAIKCNETIGW
jgi:hypothetical protein